MECFPEKIEPCSSCLKNFLYSDLIVVLLNFYMITNNFKTSLLFCHECCPEAEQQLVKWLETCPYKRELRKK